MNVDKHRYKKKSGRGRKHKNILSLSMSICVYLWLIFLTSCSTKPTDMRTLVPAETLVYLETNDLAAALQPIVDAKPFKEVAKTKPDFSALKGVQLAVAVTGFETSEEKLTDEHSVGRVQPHFVAVADTHAFHYQAVAFAEKKLGGFVTEIYDSEPTLERSDKHGGKYFIWTARANEGDGRKAYALVLDSIIYFGNDESAIEKCLTVKRGEADSVAKSGKVKAASQETLASGYVSTDGVAQIANIAGLQFASQASDEGEVQSAIAGILPQLIRNSVTDVTWTQTKTEQGIEDIYQIGMPTDMANVFSETMVPSDSKDFEVAEYFPTNQSVTVYNINNPQLAWRSLLLVMQKMSDPLAGKIFATLAESFVEPYGIRDPEGFLSSVGPILVTSKCSENEDENPIIGSKQRGEMAHASLLAQTRAVNSGEGAVLYRSLDGQHAAFFDAGVVIAGDYDCVAKISGASYLGQPPISSDLPYKLRDRHASIITFGNDRGVDSIVALLAREGHGDTQAVSTYLTETRFTKSGMERKTTSDFGLIGAIIAQLAQD